MDDFEICPACQRKNTSDVTHCIYCGTLLKASIPKHTVTTKGVQITPPGSAPQVAGCAQLQEQLADDSIALLVVGSSEPLIIHHLTSVVFGRGESPPGVEFVDLAQISDMVLGISRQHARITRENSAYWLEDMHSTNGTWLNRKRLVPGIPYSLAVNDTIWFGPIKLSVCFKSEQIAAEKSRSPKEMTITLYPRNTLALPLQPLSPDYLLNYVAPYLEALAVMQQALDKCRERTAVPIHIRDIHDQHQSIAIHLDDANEIISLVNTFINPWRDEHFNALQASDESESDATELLIKELAELLAQALAPNLPETALTACTQTIIPALHTLAASPLDMAPGNGQKETSTFDVQPEK